MNSLEQDFLRVKRFYTVEKSAFLGYYSTNLVMSKRPNAWLTHWKFLSLASLERDDFPDQKRVLRPLTFNFA